MATRLIRSLYNISPASQHAVLTIGNFDGVHLGHQALVAKTIACAQEFSAPSMVMTFEPHPFEVFEKELTISRLTRFREKFVALKKTQVENVLILPFNLQLANKSAHEFIKEILVDALKVRHIVVGDDFHFGKKRQGDLALLREQGARYGFSAEALAPVNIKGERVSSTKIRHMLAKGDLSGAAEFLGRPYSMMGRIRGGAQLGRQWGIPTANIFLHRKLTPLNGIFTVLMHGIGKEPLPGVANLGIRPTVDGTRTILEVHLLNFNQDIYGRYVEVEFCKKLREEVRYPSIELLKQQIMIDIADARDYFKNNGVL